MYRIVFLSLGSMFFLECKNNKAKQVNLPYYNEATFSPQFLSSSAEVEKKIPHTIADFSFLNQDSILINQHTVENKIHVANFIFTSCGSICPTMTKNLKIVSDAFQKNEEIVFLSYSVTPWIDKPNVLKKFKTNHAILTNNWHFLTGSKNEIYKLARQSYFAEEDIGFSKDNSEFLHTEHFVLIDKNKRIRGIYNGTLRLEMQQLIEDINTLTK